MIFHLNNKYINGPIEFSNIENLYNFVDSNKDSILNEVIDPGISFIDAAKFILNEFENKPMSSREIWEEIEKRELVKTIGKTPQASLNTIILNDCINTPVNTTKSRGFFKIVDKKPYKFILNNYMSKNIKETMIKNGFITIDILKEIFKKNGLDFNI